MSWENDSASADEATVRDRLRHSQPVGTTVTAVAVATTGPQTITTLSAGEIATVGLSELTYSVGDVGVVFGKLADLVAAEAGDPVVILDAAVGGFDTDLFIGFSFVPIGASTSAASIDPTPPRVVTSGPLVAVWLTGNGRVVDSAPRTWQALHAYTLRTWLIDSNDHLQVCTQAGTSGGSQPTWATDGSEITDGTAKWTDDGALPTGGSATVVVTKVTPS